MALLLDMVTTERVDHSSDRGHLAAARKVKVEHTLDRTRLKAKDQRPRVFVEGPEPRSLNEPIAVPEGDNGGFLLTGGCGRGGGLARWDDGAGGAHVAASVSDAIRLSGCGMVERRGLGEARWPGCAQSKRDNLRDMRIGTEHLNLNAQRLAKQPHGLESLLIVGPAAPDEDPDPMSLQLFLILLQGADDALEGRGDIGKIGNTAADDEDLAIGARSAAGDEIHFFPHQSQTNFSPGLEDDPISFFPPNSPIVLAYSYVCPSVGAPEYSP